ncbi:nuclear transport factor 2 family protein [Pseudomonas fontis]|uniref:Nuclear transport factor 2 family protein n=1 Tax=Pseudomonas fontis TaxID=2942633 RepID=A0ABT5NYD7_9PSED|nr:nuclear transport factor 2 family protein [Pseudomonas fontis]MDD0977483.1 nuclear transport factor 2 family protein [Pseudomonas fontis]MDD0993093.1 nuclear transport factor 2 family protein [Pseudomonas fontis]
MSEYLKRFAQRFCEVDAAHLDLLAELYSEDIQFRDPLHHVQGLPALRQYFAQLYANIHDLRFEFHAYDQVQEGLGYLRWTLHYRHPRLNAGKPVAVRGCSCLMWDDKVRVHHDYFDAGALLYEHVPVMGRMISWLKGRLA